MAGTLHPTVEARGDWIDITARKGEILANHSPSDVRLINSLPNRAAFGIVVRKKVLLGHSPAVRSCYRQKLVIKHEPCEAAPTPYTVHLIKALLFERLNLANALSR